MKGCYDLKINVTNSLKKKKKFPFTWSLLTHLFSGLFVISRNVLCKPTFKYFGVIQRLFHWKHDSNGMVIIRKNRIKMSRFTFLFKVDFRKSLSPGSVRRRLAGREMSESLRCAKSVWVKGQELLYYLCHALYLEASRDLKDWWGDLQELVNRGLMVSAALWWEYGFPRSFPHPPESLAQYTARTTLKEPCPANLLLLQIL